MKKTIITVAIAAVAIVAIILIFVFVNDGLTFRFGQGTAEYNINSYGSDLTREISDGEKIVGYVKILSQGKESDDGVIKLKEKSLKKGGESGYFIEMEIGFLTSEIVGETNKFIRFSIGESSYEIGVGREHSLIESSCEISERGEYTIFTLAFYTPKTDYYVLSITSVREGTTDAPSFGD